MTMKSPPAPGPVAAGQICDPDNISTADQKTATAQQLVCQLTDDTETVMMPPEFQNALKGDVILAPGGTSTISQLFLALSPPQHHSHSGIMTKNFVEITHCTAAESRMTVSANLEGFEGLSGFNPDVITYGWPGSITQTVDAAINGENWIDPSGASYWVAGFSAEAIGATNNDRFVLTPPLVLKPSPESAETRTKLRAVADLARSKGGQVDGTGKVIVNPGAHYRFYCYTKPEIVLTTVAPPEAGWAAGTLPAVCSSFIWYCMHQSGVHFETTGPTVTASDLAASAVSQGAEVANGALDGLFFYSQAERIAGGNVLNAIFMDQVLDQLGAWQYVPGFGDVASHMSDQLLNTFASDDAKNGWGSDAWQTPGDANAVSPDNLRWWKPPTLGVLGYAEPLQFLDAHPEHYTVSRWKTVITYGTISGKVTIDGAAADKALVRVYDGKETYTDSDGKYKLEHVPLGPYHLSAEVLHQGYEYTVTKKITLEASAPDLTVDLVLAPPSKTFRRLDILWTCGMGFNDFNSFPQVNNGPDQQSIPLSKGDAASSLQIDSAYPGTDMYNVQFTFDAVLAVDLSIEVTVWAKLYDDEDQSDLEASYGPWTFVVPIGESVRMVTTEMHYDGGTWAAAAVLWGTLTNSQDG